MVRPGKAVLLAIILGIATQQGYAAEFKANEVIVKYKRGIRRTRLQMNAFYKSLGVRKVSHNLGTISGLEHLVLENGMGVTEVVSELRKSDLVAYAQPNYILRALPVSETLDDEPGGGDAPVKVPCVFPGIPFPPGCSDDASSGSARPELKDAPEQVNPPVADPDLTQAWGIAKVGAVEAWKLHRGSKDIIVADIDTGIDYNHQDLAANLYRNPNPSESKDIVGYDFIHNDGLPFDDQDHGTHTAGTIGAVGGNGVAISGVAQSVSLMGLKFLDKDGSGTTADAIRAIDYAIEHGARIMSNSWGGKADPDNDALSDAIERARQKGILFIAAAGNSSEDNDTSDASYPAAFAHDNIISVAATDDSDQLASFSNYGVKSTHLAAPGVKVYSTLPKDRYKRMSGTSMACPHVAGAAALLWSAHPEWDYKKVKDVLLKSVDVLPSLAGKVATSGRLNVLRALQYSSHE
jgi:subtilisin family serine protease